MRQDDPTSRHSSSRIASAILHWDGRWLSREGLIGLRVAIFRQDMPPSSREDSGISSNALHMYLDMWREDDVTNG